MTRLAIVRRALDLRQKHGLQAPVDVERLCRLEGIDIERWKFSPHIREMIYEDGIAINEREVDPYWQRYLVAHAIGHAILHAGSTEFWRSLPTGDHIVNRREYQANLFARTLCITAQEWDQNEGRPDTRLRLVFGIPTEVIRVYRQDVEAGNYAPWEWAARERLGWQ